MKQFHPKILALALSIVSATACSRAEEPKAPAPSATPSATAVAEAAPHPAVLDPIKAQGLEVLGEFQAPGGLRGFAGLAGGQQPVAVYVTPDGEHAVLGMLIDATGQDIGQPHLQRLVAEPMSKRIWAQLGKSHWVADGRADAPRVVYTFSDPNCPFCNRFWQAARPWVDAGKVQIRHILVGVIREDSANKAAAILTAPAPSQALAQNERNYANGGIAGKPTVPAAVREKLENNQQLMTELGFQGTPGILFRDEKGVVQRRSGMPQGNDLTVVLGPR